MFLEWVNDLSGSPLGKSGNEEKWLTGSDSGRDEGKEKNFDRPWLVGGNFARGQNMP